MKTVFLDKLPRGAARIKSLPARRIGGIMRPATTHLRKFRRKIICSGPPKNAIDFRMRKKYDRKIGKPIVKFYEV